MLRRLQATSHNHLIRVIAYCYTPKNEHFFVFPWAKAGNLRHFWHSQPSLGATSLDFGVRDWTSYLTWFFLQLVGLSAAIKKLHYPDNESNPDESCRHGDLKPENILCFGQQELGPGRIPTEINLVITDAGHAKVHDKATEFRIEMTKTEGGTTKYSPPEANSKTARTRRYDIWSAGCLYLEFLIWILYGTDGLDKFHDDIGDSRPFYKLDPVDTKSEVKQWIKGIKEDPRCSPGPTALEHLAGLIEERLLNVRVLTRTNETTAEDEQRITKDEQGIASVTNGKTTVDGPPPVVVRAPTFRSDVLESNDRADAKEMHKEIEGILNACEKGSIAWMNWDGMKNAAKRRSPEIVTHLGNQPRPQPGGGAANNRLMSENKNAPKASYKIFGQYHISLTHVAGTRSASS